MTKEQKNQIIKESLTIHLKNWGKKGLEMHKFTFQKLSMVQKVR